jgi:D-alanyl-D-alanine carboxypeptidase/D-alanyl-D-alanine-endopeptidase (penicillin-binding protein 4)
MIGTVSKKAVWLSIVVSIFIGGTNGIAQSAGPSVRPMLQDIKIQPEPSATHPTPLIKRTGSIVPSKPDVVLGTGGVPNAARSSFPILAETPIPGYSGVLVETLNGDLVVESASEVAFNPASNVKIATSYAVIKAFGPSYRFATSVWTDGSYEESTATLQGNLYVSGRDPVFGFEHAVAIANELNRMGIRTVQGDLVVTDNFAMNYSGSPVRSSQTLFASLDVANRSAAANRAWSNYRLFSGKLKQSSEMPSVAFSGSVYVQPMPSNAKMLFSHESAQLIDIVKAMMCYSNNFLADRLGDMLGGPFGVARYVQQNVGVGVAEFSIQTSSGLGINRVTPVAMMKLLRSFRTELSRSRMTFADVMPVAGIDKGTLENRFDTDFSSGSVIGKTGTLGNTDGGVSALAGEMNTRNGRLLFVIFNQRGNVSRFRSFQNGYVSTIQGQFGGAAPISYTARSLDVQLAKTRIAYPNGRVSGGDDD